VIFEKYSEEIEKVAKKPLKPGISHFLSSSDNRENREPDFNGTGSRARAGQTNAWSRARAKPGSPINQQGGAQQWNARGKQPFPAGRCAKFRG
jgi:hypothetical protein